MVLCSVADRAKIDWWLGVEDKQIDFVSSLCSLRRSTVSHTSITRSGSGACVCEVHAFELLLK